MVDLGGTADSQQVVLGVQLSEAEIAQVNGETVEAGVIGDSVTSTGRKKWESVRSRNFNLRLLICYQNSANFQGTDNLLNIILGPWFDSTNV